MEVKWYPRSPVIFTLYIKGYPNSVNPYMEETASRRFSGFLFDFSYHAHDVLILSVIKDSQ